MYLTPYSLLLASALAAQGAKIEHCSLDVYLIPPGGFHAEAVLKIANVTKSQVSLFLNKTLEVTAAEDRTKGKVSFQNGISLPRRYHGEGHPVIFRLAETPKDGRVTLRISYRGRAKSGNQGSDWRGILYVGEDHARMCEQTIFYPLIPLSRTSPAVQRVKATVVVHVPAAFEIFAPGELVEKTKENDKTTRWRFECKTPSLLSILAGRYNRVEKSVGGTKIVTLMFPPSKQRDRDLGNDFADAAAKVLHYYQETYGGVPSKTLGIVEIRCRQDRSYNWAAQDLVVFDRGALRNGVPLGTLAHEIAHLWWGQAVRAGGDGERFLTESFAEYSSWRYLDHAGQKKELLKSVRRARSRYLAAAELGQDTALGKVGFRTKGYNALAYAKGPLVLRSMESHLGKRTMGRHLPGLCHAMSRHHRNGARASFILNFDSSPESSTHVSAQAAWVEHKPANTPPLRWGHALAYDSARGLTIMFGGTRPFSFPPANYNDTWAWQGTDWKLQQPTQQPSARQGHAMAYDTARQRVVLFGGSTDSNFNFFGDTWEWDGTNWIERKPRNSPTARALASMAYDPIRRRMVLFGGMNATFGAGCKGSAGTPTLMQTGSSRPWLGETLQLRLAGVPSTGPAALNWGFSRTSWNGVPLPLDLTGFGMPGCMLHVSPDTSGIPLGVVNGEALWAVKIPVVPILSGLSFYLQGYAADASANAWGVVVSNGYEARVGIR